MARFSANLTDSSEDEDELNLDPSQEPPKNSATSRPPLPVDDDEDSDEEASSSSSSSDMQEDELITSPRRRKLGQTRDALIEDDDGEIRYAHEISKQQPVSKKHPPRQRGDPTIIPWAQQLGVDAQKMHVMQTSLFRMPEEAAAMKASKGRLATTVKQLQLPSQSMNRKHSRDSDGDGMRMDQRERASFAHDIEPMPYRPSRKYARVESWASSATGYEGAMVDAGLSMGRSFRVGWGPGATLVHLGSLCSPFSTSRTSANSTIITKSTIPIFPRSNEYESNRLLKLLTHHLSHTSIIRDADGIPFANPSPSLRFSSFTSLYTAGNRSYEAAVYRLGHALFDDIDLNLSPAAGVTVDIRNRIAWVRRKAALSAWLEEAVAPSVDASLKANPSNNSSLKAYILLTGNQVEKACEEAMDGGNMKLATLISQAAGDFEFREDLRAQLQVWREQKVDVHVDVGVRKVYALLAGMLDVVEGSNGTGLERCKDVDIFEGLDWKRAFGVHLWFAEPMDAPIAQVFESYDRQRIEFPERVMGPRTWYTEHPPSPSSLKNHWNLLPSSSTPDALFSLIRLHSDPACSLSQIFDPLSFGSSPLDYSIPWHLYIILSRCMRVRDFSDRSDPGVLVEEDVATDDRVEGHSPSADLLASGYALQLENLGLLQEAVFVLLHIEGSAGREKAIKDLLARQAMKLDDWAMRGFCGSLKIPLSWVNEAKAIHALDKGEVYQAYESYLMAQLYNPAHELAVLELAPDAIIRKDLDLLKDIFERFNSKKVDNWNTRGKVFLDYAHVMTRLPELQASLDDAVPDATQASELDDLVRGIPKLIDMLPNVLRNQDDPRHIAALADMVAELILKLDKVKPLALSQSQMKLAPVDDATKLRHIHSSALERFMKTVQVA